jgi:hypothetical protein
VTNQIYRIRNPWGVDVYSGNWRDVDVTHWTTSAISQAAYVNNTNDGDFFIEDKDFVQAYDGFIVSYYHDAYVNSYVSLTSDNLNAYAYKFTTTKTEEVNIMIDFYAMR